MTGWQAIHETFTFDTRGRTHLVDLTDRVRRFLADHHCENGQLVVLAKGSTGAISTVEFEPGLKADLPAFFETIAPYEHSWKHHETWGCDNGAAHIRATLTGPSCAFPVIAGEIPLGTWQQIVLIDFDTRPRTRTVIIQFTGTTGEMAAQPGK